MRHLATIQVIADVQPIEGADSIEKVKVKDWWCVSKKGEFKVDDLCVYFEIDSLLPSSNPAFSFLEKGTKTKSMTIDGVTYTGYRLKTIRLRGQISQGLALPLSILGGGGAPGNPDAGVGYDVSESLGVVKYEAPVPAQLAGKIKGHFPHFIPKTDEERIQNCGHILQEFADDEFYVTEKLDGSSVTFYKKNGVFGVCSRNLDLLETEGNSFWAMARKYNLEERLPDNIAIQGELVGPGVQGNPLKLAELDVYIYNVYLIPQQAFATYLKMEKIVTFLGMKTVPIMADSFVPSQYKSPTAMKGLTVEELLRIAERKSAINPEVDREGIVCRPMREARAMIGGQEGRVSFKAISNAYLLNEK